MSGHSYSGSLLAECAGDNNAHNASLTKYAPSSQSLAVTAQLARYLLVWVSHWSVLDQLPYPLVLLCL